MFSVRTTGLLFALAVVVVTVVSLRGRLAGQASTPAPAASSSAPRERIILGGHTVEIFVAPPPSSATGAGK